MENEFIYNTSIIWENDRIGEISGPGLPNVKVATPPEFPEGIAGYWSPEHMFTASANICLMTTFLAIAKNSSFNFLAYSSDAEGKLEKIDGRFIMSEITLKPVIKVKSESDIEKGIRLIEKAEHNCLISNS
ncbi:MAG: OsmC family protein, partial [Bacteroidota bacterium]|nr:OsmC family protein [Bacteroidota bacterium]